MTTRGARGLCVAFVTCPSHTVARRLAAMMVRTHAAACVNIIGPLTSLFWWQGKMDRAREYLLMVKLTRRKIAAVRQLLRRHHPYTVPELVTLSVTDGLPAYLAWVRASCR